MAGRLHMFVFLHIPKTAGTTVREVLIQHVCPDRALRIDDISRIAYCPDSWLNSHDFISGHFGASLFKRLSADARTFTMLREPVARVRSQYRFLERLAQRDSPFNMYRALLRGRSLAELLTDSADTQINSLFRDTQTWALMADYQHHYRDHNLKGERALAIARDTLASMTSFGIVEEMELSLRLLSDRMGWSLNARGASHVRANAHVASPDDAPADATADESLDAIIREHNPLDVALYDWASARFRDIAGGSPDAAQRREGVAAGAAALASMPETRSMAHSLQLRLHEAEERIRDLETELAGRWNRMNPRRFLTAWGKRRD